MDKSTACSLHRAIEVSESRRHRLPIGLLFGALRAFRAVFHSGCGFGNGERGAGNLGDEAVAEAGAVEGGVAGVLPGDLQGEDEGLGEA